MPAHIGWDPLDVTATVGLIEEGGLEQEETSPGYRESKQLMIHGAGLTSV